MLSLISVPPGTTVKIIQMAGGRGVQMRLFQLGLHPGDTIRILSIGPFGGPLYIENLTTGVRAAIGRGVARRILVQPVR
ncbi:MAG: ferrous iron transport protein A [Candidatus Hydrothermae bacterium]|nr:ferrous iron transport protein A [Candidatus Hydrothermae bacterium]